MITEPWSLFSLLTFLLSVHFFAGSSPRPGRWAFAWLPLPSYLLGCCIICNDCKAAKTLFMQNTGNFIYISSYHLLCEGVLVTIEVHNETAAVNCRICKNVGMQTTISIHNVELLLGHKGSYSRQLIFE